MRAAIYSRVSTGEQDNDNQLMQLREYCQRQGWELASEYVDSVSGGSSNREKFQQMFTDASQRRFDILLFWSLDRLSREGVYETLQHLNRLTGYGIAWRSFTEQYLDSTGIFRDAVISILAVIAKQEKVRISERTKAGLAKAKLKGRVPGRPRALKPYEVNEAATMRERSDSWHSIARHFDVHPDTIKNSLASTADVHL